MGDYSTITAQVQKDWKSREFIENISINILKITEFLNRFDLSTRFRIATVNEKLKHLERRIEYIEASMNTVLNPLAASQPQGGEDVPPPPPPDDTPAAGGGGEMDDAGPPPPPPPGGGDFGAPPPPPPPM